MSQVVEQAVIFLCSYRLITHKLICMVYKHFFYFGCVADSGHEIFLRWIMEATGLEVHVTDNQLCYRSFVCRYLSKPCMYLLFYELSRKCSVQCKRLCTCFLHTKHILRLVSGYLPSGKTYYFEFVIEL